MCASISPAITLDPADWYWAAWRRLSPLPRPEPEPFDLADCFARLERAKTGRQKRHDWSKVGLAPALSDEEARFWFEAMLSPPDLSTRELTQHLARVQLEREADHPVDLGRLRNNLSLLRPEIVLPLAHFLSTPAFVEILLLGDALIPDDPPFAPGSARYARNVLRDGFRRFLLPYLDDAQRQQLRLMLRGRLDLDAWPSDGRSVPIVFSLAASLGLHDELRPLVESWPDAPAGRRAFVFQNNERQNVVFGLGGSEEIHHHLRRLRLRPLQPEHARAWLANLGLDALDSLCDTIQALPKQDQATRVLEVLCLVKAPEAAPHLLELKLNSQVPKLARQWLDENVESAVAGLMPLAAGRGKNADAAREHLADLARMGHRALVEERLRFVPATVAGRLRRDLLPKAPPAEPLGEKEPRWLRDALEETPASRSPDWLRLARLPAVIVGKRSLNDAHRLALISALRASTPGEPQPLVRATREEADRASLADFGWKLLESWLDAGMPSSGVWALNALAHCGDDAAATKVAALLPAWQDRDGQRHAQIALECLATLGSDVALLHLVRFARDPAAKALSSRASELLGAVARRRLLTRDQLEDSLLPGPGANGVFDYGARHFHLTLGGDLKPRVLDQAGRLRRRLPRPRTREAAKAAIAARQWQALEQHLRGVAKLQTQRLEEAMIARRRWSVDAFESLLGHPLTGVLARGLIWGGYDDHGQRVWTFRVGEEGCVGLHEECSSDAVASLGIVHPAELSEQELRAWRETFAVRQPFAQLDRPVVLLTPADGKRDDVTWFEHLGIPASFLWRTARKQGWSRAGHEVAAIGWAYVRRFGPVTAVVELEGRGALGASGRYDWLSIRRCFFQGGRTPLRLGLVDRVVASEVLKDLEVLAAKGQPMPVVPRVMATTAVGTEDAIPF